MSFTSPTFLLFLLILFPLYFLCPKRRQWCLLLAASYIFYALSDVRALVFILFTTAITYGAGLWLARRKENRRAQKPILAFALLLVFGVLFFVKYLNFVTGAVNSLSGLLGWGAPIPHLDLLLPLGLSFYIFQSAGYVVDVYRSKIAPERNVFRFALFVSFFPQIIQGPIGRYDRLAETLYAPHRFDADKLKYGLQLILWGLFKKLVIADRVAAFVGTVMGDHASYGGAVIFSGVLMYCLQIYCDFSGGIDIARGVAQGLGIALDENFKRPYFARSVSDFWRRWHITLGGWMREYVFYPLSLSKPFARLGKRCRKRFGPAVGKVLPAALATFIVFFLVGLWHGASWKYVAFGLYNGVLITSATLLAATFTKWQKKLGIDPERRWYKVFAILRTFLLVCIGRYFSRAASLMTALRMLKKTVVSPQLSQLTDGTLLKLGLSVSDFVVVALSVGVLFFVSARQEKGVEIRRSLEKRRFVAQWAVMLLAIFAIVFFGIYRGDYVAQQFIYAQF